MSKLRTAVLRVAKANPQFRIAVRKALIREVQAHGKVAWRMPQDPSSWQLYEDSPGVGQAARALTAALTKARAMVTKALGTPAYANLDPDWDHDAQKKVAQLLSKVYQKVLAPVMTKYSVNGAEDSEPGHVASRGISAAAKEFYGITSYTSFEDF